MREVPKRRTKFIFIPVANRFDLAEKAFQSIKDFPGDKLIMDVSGDRESTALSDFDFEGAVSMKYMYSVPFNIVQNMARATAIQNKADYYVFMHNDAEFVDPKGIRSFCKYVESLDFDKWGVVFTNYDTVCAYNTKAMDRVGEWDLFIQQYFADNDMYRRIEIAGYTLEKSEFDVLHHNDASSTIKADPKRLALNGATFPLLEKYYTAKWGNTPGHEVYTVPFNNNLFEIK